MLGWRRTGEEQRDRPVMFLSQLLNQNPQQASLRVCMYMDAARQKESPSAPHPVLSSSAAPATTKLDAN